MNIKKGAKNIVYSLIGQVIALGLGIFVPRLIIISYGSEVNGLLTSVSQVITYLALLEAGVGTASLQALYKPIASGDRENTNAIMAATSRYFKKTGWLYLFCIVAISLIYPIFIKTSLDYLFIVTIVLLCGLPNVINYFFQGKLKIFLSAVGDNYIVTNLATVTNILATVAKIVLLSLNVNVLLVQAIYCIISLLQMLVIYLYVKKKYGWIDFKVEPDYHSLDKKDSAIIHQICGLVTNSTDLFLISIFCDLNAASIYAVYNMLFIILYNAAYSVNSGLQFLFGEAYNKDKKKYIKVIDAYETYYTGLCSVLMLVTYISILPFLKLYTAGSDINYINMWLPLLFVWVEMLRAIRNSAMNTINVSGYFRETTKHAIVESILNLLISIVAVQFLGIIGCLVGTIVAFFYRDVVSIWYANKKILQRSVKTSLKITVGNLLMLTAFMICSHFINLDMGNYFKLILTAGLLTLLFGGVFFALNSFMCPDSFRLIFHFIKQKIKRNKGEENEK